MVTQLSGKDLKNFGNKTPKINAKKILEIAIAIFLLLSAVSIAVAIPKIPNRWKAQVQYTPPKLSEQTKHYLQSYELTTTDNLVSPEMKKYLPKYGNGSDYEEGDMQ